MFFFYNYTKYCYNEVQVIQITYLDALYFLYRFGCMLYELLYAVFCRVRKCPLTWRNIYHLFKCHQNYQK